MRYFKQYKNETNAFEVTKEKARETLNGSWKNEYLDYLFQNGKEFRLYTNWAEVWTVTDDGKAPISGFYGTVE